MTDMDIPAIRARDAQWSPLCSTCGEPKGGRHDMTAEECGRLGGFPEGICRGPEEHHPYIAASGPGPQPGDVEAWDRHALLAFIDLFTGPFGPNR